MTMADSHQVTSTVASLLALPSSTSGDHGTTFGTTGRVLPFDSCLCGFPVGKFEISEHNVEQHLSAADTLGLRLVYGFIVHSTDRHREALLSAALRQAGRLVDHRTTLWRAVGRKEDQKFRKTGAPAHELDVVEWHGPSNEESERMAVLAGAHSRFVCDPGFSEHVGPALFVCWCRRLCAGELNNRQEIFLTKCGFTRSDCRFACRSLWLDFLGKSDLQGSSHSLPILRTAHSCKLD